MFKLNTYLSLFFSLVLLMGQGCAQVSTDTNTDNYVLNSQFDRTIKKYLKFSVPIISVDTLFINSERYSILDAREMEEYNTSHIPNAKYIGYDSPNFQVLDDLDKSKPVVLYCSIGYRSEKIGEKLKAKGFDVYNLYGSIFEWSNKNYPLVNQSEKSTINIHGYNKSWSKWLNNKSHKITY